MDSKAFLFHENEIKNKILTDSTIKRDALQYIKETQQKRQRNDHEIENQSESFYLLVEYKSRLYHEAADSKGKTDEFKMSHFQKVTVAKSFETEKYVENLDHWPFAIFVISLIELVGFRYANLEVSLRYDASKRHQVWRFVTYALVHKRFEHLLSNLISQCILGTWLEVKHGWWRVTTIYIFGVLAGSLMRSIFIVDGFMIGASGGVYALFAGYIAAIIMNWHQTENAVIKLYVLLIVISTVIHNALTSSAIDGGDLAHIGGIIAGILVGIGILKNYSHRDFEEKLKWIAITLFTAFIISAIVHNILL